MASSVRSIGLEAKVLGLRDPVSPRWVNLRGAGREPTAPHNAGDAAAGGSRGEITRLQRENERLRMERDISKTSIAIFAGTWT